MNNGELAVQFVISCINAGFIKDYKDAAKLLKTVLDVLNGDLKDDIDGLF